MKQLLTLNRLLSRCDTLAQGLIRSHFNVLWEKHQRETEHYRQLWQMGIISYHNFKKVTQPNYKNLVQELTRLTKQVSQAG